MDMESYEETRLKRDEEWAKYLKEGTIVTLQTFNGKARGGPPFFCLFCVFGALRRFEALRGACLPPLFRLIGCKER